MTNNLPSPSPTTTKLLQDARAAFDAASRTHHQWRGQIIGDETAGARRVILALDATMEHLAACRAALVQYIKEREHS